MGEVTLSDTKEKMIMQDHDILIQLTTQMGELIRRIDASNQINQEQTKTFAVEMRGVSMEQVRVSSELKSLREDLDEHKAAQIAWQARWEQKSNIWDILNSFGILVSAAIGYFLGK